MPAFSYGRSGQLSRLSFVFYFFHFLSVLCSRVLETFTRTRSSFSFWHSGVFEYVLAVTDHSFGFFFLFFFSTNCYSNTSFFDAEMTQRYDSRSFFPLPLLLSSLFFCRPDDDTRRLGRRNCF